MTNQPPSQPAYQLPDDGLAPAAHRVLDDLAEVNDRLGRVMAVVTAAAVRDILTGGQPGAPFDAASVELVEADDGSLSPTGRYWTTAGDERTFAEAVGETDAGSGLHDMWEWTAYLDDDTRDVWLPLCSRLPDRDGRPAYRLDLIRAAALPVTEPTTVARPLSAMVDVTVCANERDHYPAKVDPADQRDGHVRPWFDLDTVRRIAADTQADAARYGHGSIDTVHVLDGTVDRTAHAVVLVIAWMYLGGERHEKATEVLQPNAVGRYAVGGHDWCWYVLDDGLMPQIPFQPATA